MNLSTILNAAGAGIGVGAALGNRLYRRYPEQTTLLSDLRTEEEWLLIILDACRYGAFEELGTEFFDCTTTPVWSSGRNTFEYVRKAWPDTYPDVHYLSAAPVVNSNRRQEESAAAREMFRGYIASEHIGTINELFKLDAVDEIGTCPPELVTKTALEAQSRKMVAHYFQPHAPFIGSDRIVRRDENGVSDTKLIWDAVRSGELSLDEVRRAYNSNLERALHSVARLVDSVEYDNIIITADHGEALGEYRVLSHPDRIPYHPQTRVVPWVEVESVAEYTEWDVDLTAQQETNKSVEDRLSQLGYLE